MSLYNASRRAWKAFDNAPLGECDPDFYDTHCQGCDGELEHDKACLACMTPDELAARARKTILDTQAWQRSLRQGYGVYWNGKKNVAAHRFVFAALGKDIPDGLVVDHTCRNRACVNPSHLRMVDRLTNVHENSVAIAHIKSLQTHCLRGHSLTGHNLLIDRGRRRCRACKNEQSKQVRSRKKGTSNG